ncbi:MAG TPA: hypothetical protein VHC22_17380 [Pirellulales bacterium]|nr:hypothetical protein [Pirellulales bacterium]
MSEPISDELPLEGMDWPCVTLPDAGLRAALLEKTGRLVRRRARHRRLRQGAGWALAYAAGIATAWFIWSHEPANVPRAGEQATARSEPIPPAENPAAAPRRVAAATPRPGETDDLSSLSPEELRGRVAGAPRPEQIRLLRLAGDRYLFGQADLDAALDCYRQIIELTPRGELARQQTDDSWLLAELKSSAATSLADMSGE